MKNAIRIVLTGVLALIASVSVAQEKDSIEVAELKTEVVLSAPPPMDTVSRPDADRLKEAFKRGSQDLLDSFINANRIRRPVLSKGGFDSRVRGVLTALFEEYVSQVSDSKYADARPFGEEYLTAQPIVNVCFSDRSDIDSA